MALIKNTSIKTWLLAAAIALPVALVGQSAYAVVITGSSTSTFSNLTNCSSGDCAIATGGGDTQVQWGSTSERTNLVNPSTLTAPLSLAFSGNTNTTLTIGQLSWFNSSTLSDQTDPNFNVNWNLTVAVTAPVGSKGDAQTFALNILSPTNPSGDTITNLTLADLSNLSFSIPGVTVSNFQYHVTDGSGQGTSTLTCNGITCSWYDPEKNNATLTITADFTAKNVPEPISMAILGTGLFGLGVVRRRRSSTPIAR